MAVAAATPYGYYPYSSPYVYGSPSAYAAAIPAAGVVAPAITSGPLIADSAALLKAGIPKLQLAAHKLNELSVQLPQYLANIDPATKGDIVKVNGIVNDICARVIAETQPISYSTNMCAYIAKVGSDIVAGLDDPSIIQTYTAQLQTAITALNVKATEIAY